jgi:hypothetical protein
MRVWRALTLPAVDKDSPPALDPFASAAFPSSATRARAASEPACLRACVRACMRAVGRFAEFWLPPL